MTTNNKIADPVPAYKSTKPLDTILTQCKANGWPVNTDAHDNHGSDFVMIGFVHNSSRFEVALNTFNGKFIVKHNGEYVTEESTEFDGVEWYRALLDFLYVRKV